MATAAVYMLSLVAVFGILPTDQLANSTEPFSSAANDGLFPDRFRRLSKAGVPAFGIVSSTALGSVAVIVNYLGSTGATAFTTLILMTGITASIPYGFSALAQIKWCWRDREKLDRPRLVRDLVIAGLAVTFSVLFIWYSRNTGHGFWVYWAPFFLAGAALLLASRFTAHSAAG
jgi:APA family basic amino acid/polyamine antiporter